MLSLRDVATYLVGYLPSHFAQRLFGKDPEFREIATTWETGAS